MLKEITTSIILATSIGIQPIINNNSQVVYMDNMSYWTNDIYNEEGNTPYIKSYRNRQTNSSIANDSYTINQRICERYINYPEDGIVENNYYFCLYATTNYQSNAQKFRHIYLTIDGLMINTYQFESATLKTYKTEVPMTNTTILNFINGETYTTKQQYTSLLSQLDSINYNTTQNLTEQDYANVINDHQINYIVEEPTEYIQIIMKLTLAYASDDLPLTEPYSPFYNYGKSINYREIQWTADVPQNPTGEIVDIPGMLLMIVGMPFTFIAQSFNLTIFPGTMYEVNLAMVFFAIVGAGILLFIIKRFLK